MPTDDPQKLLVVFVDHEEEDLPQMMSQLKEKVLTDTTMRPLSDTVQLEYIVVEPNPENTLTRRVLEALRVFDRVPDLLLVDLAFGDHLHDVSAMNVGRKLALELTSSLPDTAIGVYTRETALATKLYTQISSDRFAAFIPGVMSTYERRGKGMSGDEWQNLFKKMKDGITRDVEGVLDILGRRRGLEVSTWSPGHPNHRSPSFVKAGPALADLALQWLATPPSEILLSQLGGGFSGSYILRADIPGRSKSYIIKIDEDPQRIQQELDGYRYVQTFLSHKHYLHPLGSDPHKPITLARDWWGALAMEYESTAKPLIDHTSLPDDSLAAVYRRIWNECLSELYGSISESTVTPEMIIPHEMWTLVNENWRALERYHGRLGDLNDDHRSAVEQLLSQLGGDPVNVSIGFDSISIPMAERVHGDLNCRNVLYDPDDNSFLLIDFPRVGSPACVAVDFVKAEAELILIMLDWAAGFDCDFARLPIWSDLTSILASGLELTIDGITDDESKRVVTCINEIRQAYVNLTTGFGDIENAYRSNLLAVIPPYIGYAGITPAKKSLALIWAGQLSNADWSS